LQLIAGSVAATTAIHKGESDSTTQRCPDRDAGRNRDRHLKDGPWMRSE
jgi:hypothetical protein